MWLDAPIRTRLEVLSFVALLAGAVMLAGLVFDMNAFDITKVPALIAGAFFISLGTYSRLCSTHLDDAQLAERFGPSNKRASIAAFVIVLVLLAKFLNLHWWSFALLFSSGAVLFAFRSWQIWNGRLPPPR